MTWFDAWVLALIVVLLLLAYCFLGWFLSKTARHSLMSDPHRNRHDEIEAYKHLQAMHRWIDRFKTSLLIGACVIGYGALHWFFTHI